MTARLLRAHAPHLTAWVVGIVLVLSARSSDAAGTFRTIEPEGLRIIVDADWGQRLTPGYLPVRLDVTNLADPRAITLVVQSTRFSPSVRGSAFGARTYTSGRRTLERTLQLPRGARARFTMAMPISAENENLQLTVRDGNRVLQVLSLGNVQSNASATQAAVLIVAGASGSPFSQQAPGWARQNSMPTGYGGPRTLVDVVLEPPRIPATWVGYTSLRAVIIGAGEWQQLSDDQRSALRRWTAAGGDLIVADGDPATPFAPGISIGTGEASASTVPYFFGALHRTTSPAIAAAGLEGVLSGLHGALYGSWRLPVTRAVGWHFDDDQGFLLPIPGIGRVHARGYLTLLLVFAVLIGPINYVLLRRRGLQPLLVVTAPLLAVVFLVLLGTYVVAGEGFSVHARAATFTLLDQQRQEAVTRSSVSIYAAGTTPGGGLQFSPDTAVYPFDAQDGQDDIHIDLGRGQQFDSGLVRARTPANVETIEWRPARERLTFSRQGDTLRVSNGLGVTVSKLLVRAGSQTYQLSRPLAPGSQAALSGLNTRPLMPTPTSHPLYARFDEAVVNQPANSYLAIVDRPPSWNGGITHAVETDSVHMILGLGEPLP